MILIGMFDSPFVRRVAVSMNLLKMPFEAPAADCAASGYPGLAAMAARCEALPEFSSVKVEFFPP